MSMTKIQFGEIFKQGFEATWQKFNQLQATIKEQNRRLNLNSSNSSKPPASDMNKTAKSKKNNSRKKTQKKSGGQRGHSGKTLQAVEHPDETIPYNPTHCLCGYEFNSSDAVIKQETRQVIDIPEPKVKVTSHVVSVLECPCCGIKVKGEFPENVNAPVQYGAGLKARVVYLMVYQLSPYKRTVDLLANMHKLSISEGTLNNILEGFAGRIELPVEFIKQQIIDSEVAHFDESGLYVEGRRDWLHVAATELYTFYFHHELRGFEATEAMGILDNFQGTAVHDFWKTYYKYEHILHSLCNAHHLRDLQGLFDDDNLPWSLDMKSFLSASKKIVDLAKEAGKTELNKKLIAVMENEYQQIIDEGYKLIPPPPPRKKGQRGPIKKGRARRLLERLDEKRDEILDFIYDFSKPFDNNQAERDIRMIKVKQKISGTFRSATMAKCFCKIRSYISTAIKHGVNVYDAIVGVFNNDIFLYA